MTSSNRHRDIDRARTAATDIPAMDIPAMDIPAMDRADPLAPLRDGFMLRDGLIYLDGNSLGALQKRVVNRLAGTVTNEWGRDLIASWNQADWVSLPERVGARIAPLIGARPDTVIATDSTSVNLFKTLSAALDARPGRHVIVSERGNFPTDLYMAEGLAQLLGHGHVLRLVDDDDGLYAAIDGDTAVVMLTHVDYRSGRLHDMAALTARTHDVGALIIWDLAHSAGALPVDLGAAGADFAIGCGYKYLNGGPGAPAFIHVAPHLLDQVRQPLTGWFGHAAPFALDTSYQPADGIRHFLTGTPPVLSMAALDEALGIWDEVSISAVREKSIALSTLFIALVEEHCAGHGLKLTSPRDPARRGSQVSFSHPHAFEIMQALIEQDVIGDFRAPDILRFGFAPLYTRFVDVRDAVERLAGILARSLWRAPRFAIRGKVT